MKLDDSLAGTERVVQRRSAVRWLLAGLVLIPACLSIGCAATGPRAATADYVLVYLTTGPKSAEPQGDERAKIFAGHMANIRRLADARQLIVAGPFNKPQNESWRGIFIMDVPTIGDARPLVETDPGVQAGVFTPEYRRFRSSAALRRTSALDREMKEARKATSQPDGTVAPEVRPYVMITARDAARAADALRRSTLAGAIVWSGRFRDSLGKENCPPRDGVFVVDAKTVGEVRAALKDFDCGACAIDGWFSTAALEKLPRE